MNRSTNSTLGSIWPCIFAHSFCNLYGVPLPTYGMQNYPSHKIGKDGKSIETPFNGLFRYNYCSYCWTCGVLFYIGTLDSRLDCCSSYNSTPFHSLYTVASETFLSSMSWYLNPSQQLQNPNPIRGCALCFHHYPNRLVLRLVPRSAQLGLQI
jgi:hypothetical protein